jgi:drug/metabolite transporter (DMT)-like permease
MKLLSITILALIAFAANSVLNRMALLDGSTGPASFALIRVVTGALALAAMVAIGQGGLRLIRPGRTTGALSLAAYILGFSFAYVTLDAGVGALILFGGVQITMFAGSVLSGTRPPALRWVGSAIALAGLCWLMWPAGTVQPDPVGVALMTIAALGWGIYSLAGRGSDDPLADTAANFILAAPLAALVWVVIRDDVTLSGAILATISGVLTSGLGYALWYSVLPRIEASVAALAQLTVPVIAILGGAILLAEPVALKVILACALVLGGVALGLLAPAAKR